MDTNNTFGLIGYPLTHSFSEKYFTEKLKKENIQNCVYRLYPIEDIEKFPQFIAEHISLRGLNITIPYKERIIPFLHELDPVAKNIGAVNCIKISGIGGDKKLIGYNTDVYGFRQSIKPFIEMHHDRALILGAGGAAKAAAYALDEIGIDYYFVVRNKPANAGTNFFLYSELNEYIINAFKLIINATPVGTYPNISDKPDIPYSYLSSSHLLFDMVYNPSKTEFLKNGEQKGSLIVNGLSMLHQQAEEAWKIWNDPSI